ncbi:Golgi apparatus membrane protein [Yarrowia sp. C11]|nr:Golgi apparatus membrane protein [Yarrowia sp. E02]KAG5367786.1 Golgi apparatus membrane protein [Yarrowia sp. C11]
MSDTIEPDVPLTGGRAPSHAAPAVAAATVQPDLERNAAPSAGAGMTLWQRLSESSHPVALVFFLAFRLGALFTYMFGLLFTDKFVLMFVLVVLLLAADFWNVKNIAGRLMVGLRWWNEASETGESVWVFETADPQRYINPIDSKVFWMMVYGAPVLWVCLAVLALLKFQFLSLILVFIAVSLTVTNAMAYSRCDKFGKANNIVGQVSGGLLSRAARGTFLGRFM